MKKRNTLIDIILIAIITSILTAGSSFFLTKNELSEEQKYWKERLKKERLINIQDRQIAILEDVNSRVLELEVLAREIKITAAEFCT